MNKKVGQEIHPSQVIWQVFEVVMNGWILYAAITVGLTLPLILWTMMEIAMNGWILVTLVRVGIKKSFLGRLMRRSV